MSIITDTLNRLQSSWTKRQAFDSSTKPGAYSRPEPSHHAPKNGRGRLKFWSVFFGLTLTFTAMGLGMFWFGMNGAPEMSRPSNPSTSPKPQRILKEPPVQAHSVVNQPESQPTPPPSPDPLTPSTTHEPLKPSTSKQMALHNEKVAPQSLETETPSSEPDTKEILSSTRAITPAPSQPSNTKPTHAVSQAPTIAEPKNQKTAHVSLKHIQDSPAQAQALNANAAPLGQSDSLPPSVGDIPTKKPTIQANEGGDGQASSKGRDVASFSSPPDSDAERLSKGRSLVKQRLYREAVATLNPLFATLPNQWEPWFWMGTAHMGLGQYDEAKGAFREGLARNETDFTTMGAIGHC